LFSSPHHFGIKKKKWNYYPKIPYKVYKVDSAITNLGAFARHIGCTKATIRFFNPWLLHDHLPNPGGKIYEIRIPSDPTADYSSYISDLVGEHGGLSQDPEEAPVKEDLQQPDTTKSSAKIILHVVRDNERIEELAGFYEVNPSNLRKWNSIRDKEEAVPGQTLSIYY
jgi:hypothetical protein